MRSKKAQGFLVAIKLIESIKILLLIIFGIGLFLFLLSPKSISTEIEKDVQEAMYVRGITGTAECLAYKGIGGRVDQRILDETKLTTVRLDGCLGVPVNRDVSDWHSASIYLKETNKQVNSSGWVYPLLFDFTYMPVILNTGGVHKEDMLIFYLQFN